MGQQHLQPHNDNHLVALGRTLQTLREEENADVLIETCLDYLASEFNYSLIWIGLYDRLEHRLFGKGGITPTGDTTFLKQRFHLNSGDLLEQVVIQQRLVGIPDLRQEIRAGEWRRAAQEFGIQGTILFPMRCKDRCFGVALLGSHQWGVSPRPAEKAHLSLLLGGLAAALYQIEVDWQHSTSKRADQPLFQVLDELRQLPTLAPRLDSVVARTQQFIVPTRTNLYWYSPERRYFWHRVSNQQSVPRFAESRKSAAGITVSEANDFYQALAGGQLVTIGTGRSLLSSESTQRLIARLRTRSLIAAPIQAKGQLLGFLTVEDNEARIWEETEINYVRAMAQLVGLVAESEAMEETLQLASSEAHFTAEIAQAIARSNDTSTALRDCAVLLCKRLEAEHFLVLQQDNKGQFMPIFQQVPSNRRSLTTPLAPLSPDEQQLLSKSAESVMIEDLDQDLRLFQWREPLSQVGVKSLLICQTSTSKPSNQGQTLSPLLLIGRGIPQTWNHRSRELVSIVAQQISLLLTLEQLQSSARLSFLAHQTLASGLSTLTNAPLDPVQLEHTWLDYLANLLECPLAALISWTPESNYAKVAATVVTDPRFALSPDQPIPITTDTLIQQTLMSRKFLCRSVADLSASTRQWLSSPGIGQLLVIALHTGTTPTTGIVLLADYEERRWSDYLLSPLERLTQQFAWFRYYQHHASSDSQEDKNLKTLNWYKHQCFEMLHQSVQENITTLLELEAEMLPRLIRDEFKPQPNPIDSGESNAPQEINRPPAPPPWRQIRRQHLLHQLEQSLALFKPLLDQEQWQLIANPRPVPLASLLKRSLRRVEPLYKERQLLLKVHSSINQAVYADRLKLECVLFELLVTSCFHAQPGSWINLWCCLTETKVNRLNVEGSNQFSNFQSPNLQPETLTQPATPLVELLITENGLLDECLQTLATSPSQLSISTNLEICQSLLRSWGGDLQFYQLNGVNGATMQESRYFSRLLLPLAS